MRQNVIIGYSKKDPQKGPRYVLIILAILVLLGLVYWTEKNRPQTGSEEESTTTSIKTTKPSTTLKPTTTTTTRATTTTLKPAEKKAAANSTTPKLTQAFFYNSAPDEGNLVEPSESFSGDWQKVYFYNEFVVPNPPVTIRHVWTDPKGIVQADVALELVHTDAYTWSYATISNGQKAQGKWTVKIVGPDGKTIDTKTFEYK